jgi:hypothetical protein
VLKNRLPLLVLITMALAALVWFDNQRAVEGARQGAAPIPSEQAEPEQNAEGDQRSAAPRAVEGAPEGRLQNGNPLSGFDMEQLRDTVERPLFAPTRRRPPAVDIARAPDAAASAQTSQVPGYDLLGVIVDGDRAIALVRKKGDGANFRVEAGDMIGGWRVSKVERASVLFERADGTSTAVPLYEE